MMPNAGLGGVGERQTSAIPPFSGSPDGVQYVSGLMHCLSAFLYSPAASQMDIGAVDVTGFIGWEEGDDRVGKEL